MNYKIIENLLGKIISKDEIQNICNTMQDILKEKGLDMTITPEFFISAYHHDKYFLKVVESLLIDAMIPYFIEDMEEYKDIDFIEAKELDLRFTKEQFNQVNIMTKKRRNITFEFNDVEKIVCSAVDLYINSFDQGIDDTYSRDFFFEKAEDARLIED